MFLKETLLLKNNDKDFSGTFFFYRANIFFTEQISFLSGKIFYISNRKYPTNIFNIEHLNFTVLQISSFLSTILHILLHRLFSGLCFSTFHLFPVFASIKLFVSVLIKSTPDC